MFLNKHIMIDMLGLMLGLMLMFLRNMLQALKKQYIKVDNYNKHII